MNIISSKENEQIKHIKKLKEKKYRDEYAEYLVEGTKMVFEAIKENAEITQIIICKELINEEKTWKDIEQIISKYNCIYITSGIMKQISDVKAPQGIMAIVSKKQNTLLDKNIDYSQEIIVALNNIQDPGNLGTILRTVDSLGLNQILVTKGTADVYNPKVVRSTMGAIFRVNIIECDDMIEELKKLQEKGFRVVVSSLQAQKNIYELDYNKTVIIIGNEANGVEKHIEEIADEKIIIPMLGKTESLNASVATGIILYEYVRRKITDG